jgi:hypothetical protein
MISSSPAPRALVFVLSAVLACGAKTGLLVSETSNDAGHDADDAFVRFEACVEGRFTLVRREAQVVFVIDRSGSMSQPIQRGGTSRWDAMRTVFGQTLRLFEDSIRMGVLMYPRRPDSAALASAQACDQLPGTGIDIPPRLRNADAVLDVINASGPSGATPTAAAIARAARFLSTTGSRELARYLVVATDGAPNCNLTLDPSTCVCSYGSTSCASAGVGARYCLDDDGAVTAITTARAQGISTYVVGIDGDLAPEYVAVLDRMAVAGGRSLDGPRRYYSIQDTAALTRAFEDIQRTIVRCAYVTPSRPDDPSRITVHVGATEVPRDPSRRNGWDWTDADYGELTLFGPACEQVLDAPRSLEATVACGR